MKKLLYIFGFLLFAGGMAAQEVIITNGGGEKYNETPAASFQANDLFIGADSALYFQTIVNQIRDSTVFSANTAADVVKISTSLKIGDRIFIKSTGAEYLIKQDSVRYYPTDGVNVISLGGKYAVIDLSAKRQFESQGDLKKLIHFLGIRDGETVSVNDQKFTISYFPRAFHRSPVLQSTQDVVVDGFFLDTIQMLVPTRNAAWYSEQIDNGFYTFPAPTGGVNPYVFMSGNAGIIRQNAAIAPDGTLTAERLAGFTGVGNSFAFFVRGDTSLWVSGDTVSVEFWYRGKKTSGVNERLQSVGVFSKTTSTSIPNIGFKIDGKWNKATVTVVAGGTAAGLGHTVLFGNLTGFSSTDTLELWGLDIHKGRPRSYQKSIKSQTKIGNKVYLYREFLIENETLNLGNINDFSYTTPAQSATLRDDSQFIQAAINYCAAGERCNRVVLPRNNFYIRKTVTIPAPVTLAGTGGGTRTYGSFNPYELRGTVLNFSMNNPTNWGITMSPPVGGDVCDNAGIQDLYLIALDTMAGMIKTTEVTSCKFINLTVSKQGVGIVDTGFYFSVVGSSDNHYNVFDHCYISGEEIGLVYGGGLSNFMQNCNYSGKTGIKILSSTLQGSMISVEGSNTGVHLVNTSRFDCFGFYTEGTGTSGGSSILMDGVGTEVSLEASYLQTDNASDTLINVRLGKYLSIENSKIRLPGVIKFPATYNQIKAIKFDGITSNLPLCSSLNLTERQKQFVSIKNNYPEYSNNEIFPACTSPLTLNYPSTYEGIFHNSVVDDTLALSQITLIGKRQNLVQQSDSLASGVFTFINTYSNTVTAPDGTMTADVVAVKGATSSSFVQTKFSLPVFETGKPYTISVWLKRLSPTISTTVSFSPCIFCPSAKFQVQSSDWQRYEKVVYYEGGSGQQGSFRVDDLVVGDSLAVWGWQVNEGYSALKRVKTLATGIDDQAVIIDAVGNITFQDDLYVPDEAYGPSWNGSAQVPTQNAIYDQFNNYDPSVSNEGSLGVGVGGSNNATIVSNTTGNVPVTIEGSTNVKVTENQPAGIITLTVPDTVLITLSALGITDSLKTVSTLGRDFFNVPAELAGFTVSKVEYSSFTAGAGSGSVTTSLRLYNAARTFTGSSNAVVFAVGDAIKTSTGAFTLASGQLIVPQITSDSMTTHPLGLSVVLMLTK